MRTMLAALVPLLLVACAALTPPQTLEERLAYAYATHAAVLNAAAASVEFGEISAADGRQILAIADRAEAILEGARTALAIGDTSTAEGRLALATSVLLELQNYLRRSQ